MCNLNQDTKWPSMQENLTRPEQNSGFVITLKDFLTLTFSTYTPLSMSTPKQPQLFSCHLHVYCPLLKKYPSFILSSFSTSAMPLKKK